MGEGGVEPEAWSALCGGPGHVAHTPRDLTGKLMTVATENYIPQNTGHAGTPT